MTHLHAQITQSFAAWTALSALRSGAPVKSRERIYSALDAVSFDELFDLNAGPIEAEEFDRWHRAAVGTLHGLLRCGAGWAAKLVKVYLKTRAYVAGAGRPGLIDQLHPPIDRGLWDGLARAFASHPSLLRRTHAVQKIKDIRTYAQYARIVAACREAAALLGCRLIEIEQLWEGARASAKERPAEELPREQSVGLELVLWDNAVMGEVLGVVERFEAPSAWYVRLSAGDRGEVLLEAGARSRLGRWFALRSVDRRIILSDQYRTANPHPDDASLEAFLERTAASLAAPAASPRSSGAASAGLANVRSPAPDSTPTR